MMPLELELELAPEPVSHPAVHPAPAPVEAAPAAAPAPAQGQAEEGAVTAPPGVRMGAPIWGRLGLRLVQALLAADELALVASARDFTSFTAFRYLVSATALQCLWCLALVILYIYALLVGRSFRNHRAAAILCVGDWITGALTFSAACASACINVFINNNVKACYANQCSDFIIATAIAFSSWLCLAPCCLFNLGKVVYKLQRP